MFRGWFSKSDTPTTTPNYTTKEEESGDWLAIEKNKGISPAQLTLTELKKTQEDLRVLEGSYQKICEDYASEKNTHAKTLETANKLRETNAQLNERVCTLEKSLGELDKRSNEHKLVADNALDTLQTQEKYITDLRLRLTEAEHTNEKNIENLRMFQAKNQVLQTTLEKTKCQIVELEQTHSKDIKQIDGLKQSLAESQRLFKTHKEESEGWKKKYEQFKLSTERSQAGGNKHQMYHRYR